jgi:HPt (histidine-containing phosphotransfer) domain-containing protein
MNAYETNTAQNNYPILTHEETLDRLKGDQDFLKTLYGVFVEDLPKKLAAMDEALEGHDNDSLQRTAHSLKGASATVG